MIKYVLMSKDHVSQIAEIEAMCFSAPWSQRSIESELTNPLSLWVVAMDGDTLVGYVGSQSVLGEADMMNLAVLPQYRRQGIGRMLVNALVEQLRSREVMCLSLEVRASNEGAIALYQSIGFDTVGRRPNYYSKPKEDALILRKEWEV